MQKSKLLQDFRGYLKQKRRAPTTVRGYCRNMSDILSARNFRDKKELIRKLEARVSSIPKWDRSQKPSQRRKITAANAFLVFLDSSKGIQHDPFATIPLKVPTEKPYKTITRTQFDTILDKIPKIKFMELRDVAIYCLMFNLGLREQEVVHLTLENIKTEGEETYLHVNSGLLYQRRKLKIDKETLTAINDYIEAYGNQRKETMPTIEQGTLLKGKWGNQFKDRDVRRNFRKYAKVARVDAPPSSLRHSYAKTKIKLPDRNFAELLGTSLVNAAQNKKRLKS